ncbi:MAG: hypothetical protein ACE5F1_02860 [Planctomycetota bacterium]
MRLLQGVLLALLADGANACRSPRSGMLEQPAGELLLTAPFAAPRQSFFHAALLVPPMETARLLDPAAVYLRWSSNHSHSQERSRSGGIESLFDSEFHEWTAAELRWGALPGLELSLRSAVGGWDEVEDRFDLRDSSNKPIVRFEDALLRGEASRRHTNLTRVDLGARAAILDLGASSTSAGVTWKLPVARVRDLSNAGTHDLALTLFESLDLGAVVLQGNAGIVVPLTDQKLFIPEARIDLDRFWQSAIGANWRLAPDLALGLQVEANSSAFRSVPFLRRTPVTVVGGIRKLSGKLVLEAGAGAGLDTESSYGYAFFLSVGRYF